MSETTADLARADTSTRSRGGFLMGLGAATAWGLLPAYFALLRGISPVEVLAHRITWSVVLLAALVPLMGQTRALWRSLGQPKVVLTLMATATLLGFNWLVYVSSVQTGHIVEASLGYYIMPLINVLLGRLVLGEKLSRWQVAACVLAGVAVTTFALTAGWGVWRSLVLAGSFAVYGLFRKLVEAEAVVGFTIECLVLVPFALGYLAWCAHAGTLHLSASAPRTTALLLLVGFITTIPLLAYSAAARRVTLSTLGILMYINPTIQFVFGVVVYGEAFDTHRLIAFIAIWVALAIYTAEAGRRR